MNITRLFQKQQPASVREHAAKNPKSLGNLLLNTKLITKEQLDKALDFQEKNKDVLLGEILIHEGVVDRDTIQKFLAIQKGGYEEVSELMRVAVDQTRKMAPVHDRLRLLALKLGGEKAS